VGKGALLDLTAWEKSPMRRCAFAHAATGVLAILPTLRLPS
jgi:hypothetical protein